MKQSLYLINPLAASAIALKISICSRHLKIRCKEDTLTRTVNTSGEICMKKRNCLLALLAIGLLVSCSTGTGGSSDDGTPAAIVTEKYTKQSDGSYFFSVNDTKEIDSDGKTYYCCNATPAGTGVFTYTVKLRKDSGAQNGGFGVVFQKTDSKNFWVFNINVLGSYYLAKVVDGGINEMSSLSWVFSPFLTPGYGKTNEIRIAYLGNNSYTIYANGNTVVSYTDSKWQPALTNGCFGLDTVIMPNESFPGTPLTVRYEVVSPSGQNMSEISCP